MLPYHVALRQAEAMLDAGNSAGAIPYLRDALSLAPDEVYPHILLSGALRDERRVAGARHEAELALQLDPLSAHAHCQLALALQLQRHTGRAIQAARSAVELAPNQVFTHLTLASLLRVADRRDAARESRELALAIDPQDSSLMAECGFAAVEEGNFAEAEAIGRRILADRPDKPDGLILIGHGRLAAGARDEALHLALSALRTAPNDLAALQLLAACKMKANPIGGLWWQWNRLLVKLGPSRAIYFVVFIWVCYRFSQTALADYAPQSALSSVIDLIYLGFVIYTLSAEAIVQGMIRKELARVRLKPDF